MGCGHLSGKMKELQLIAIWQPESLLAFQMLGPWPTLQIL